MKKLGYLFSLLLWMPLIPFAQHPASEPLFRILRTQDSLLFDIGFNQCDVQQFDLLIADDFEFYHDQSGITPSKSAFVDGIRDGLCTNPNHPVRKLVPRSMAVYPLYNADTLYGAIQIGKHCFYESMQDGSTQFRSIARFDHLWVLERQVWKLKRVLSYDHQTRLAFKDGSD